ncbi:MAG: SIMPL domain-containing protein [Aquabacterium sp.]
MRNLSAMLMLSSAVRRQLLPVAAAASMLALAVPSHAEADTPHNVVRFAATATQELTQDLLTITLQANKEGSQATEVQAGLKQMLEAALTEARKSAQPNAMEVRTGYFSVQPRYNSAGRVNGWQGSAQLILEGTDIARITQTSGRLNQLNVVNVGYGLSRALREQYESALTSQAIARFKTRAAQIATDFGLKSYTLSDVSVSSTEPGFEPRPYLMKAMSARAEAADAPVPVEPGKGVLSVTVNGQVVLKP